MRSQVLLSCTLALALFSASHSFADEKPPANAIPLSQLIKMLESKGFNPIVQVELDDGVWEVEAYRDNRKLELKVNPVSGKVISERPDD